MPLTIENAGALVPGVKVKEDSVATIKVKVLRGFYDGKTSLKPGEIVNMGVNLAHQAREAHKVEFLPEDPPPFKVKEAQPVEKAEISEEAKPEDLKSDELSPEPKTKHKKYGG